jgi:hypothetical protein
MVCAGASEQAVSQWASAFAETGLGVCKTAGDLAGQMLFALLMGSSRAFYGNYGERIDLDRFMSGSSFRSQRRYGNVCFPCAGGGCWMFRSVMFYVYFRKEGMIC